MAKIRVTRGGCGIVYKDGNGVIRHSLKTPESGPFECDDKQAARLVSLGAAEYVIEDGEKKEADPEPAPQPEETGEPEKATGHLTADQLESMTIEQLKNLAGDIGIDVSKCKKKADYIEAIAAVEVEIGPEVDPEDDGDELPELGAVDPE